jgi:predicted cupin superfamily sugar epimerase
MNRSASDWITRLGLVPHPEGGHFRETYRAAEHIAGTSLPSRYGGARVFGTSIYFLLRAGEVSRLHRIKSDEIWHLYAGGPLTIFLIRPGGNLGEINLGSEPDQGQAFQAVVPAGTWFGAALLPGTAYALTGCTVAPGFEFADFESGDRHELIRSHPQHTTLIERLTP